MKDLTLEKQRVRMEILKTEQEIHRDYRNILHALSLRNLASALVNEILTTHSGISTAFSIGRNLFRGKKKKKHDRDDVPGEPGMS